MVGNGKGEGAKQKGNDAFKRGQYAEAVGQYAEAILQDTNNPIYYLNRSMAYMKLNKFEDAERDASASLRLGGDSVKAYYRRGSARKQLSRWKEALQDFEKVAQLDPGNTEAKVEIGHLQGTIEAEKQRSKRTPLDADTLAKAEGQAEGRGSSSSVEAARKFLAQVGMSDQAKGEAAGAPNAIPDRFPGEGHGFLKEVSTRRIKQIEGENGPVPSSNPPAIPSQAANSPLIAEKQVESKEAEEPPVRLTEAGSPPVCKGGGKVRLSAYEFDRRLRQCGGNGDPSTKHASQLALLASLQVQSIPSMLGSLLEPELLSDLLEALLHGDKSDGNLIVDVMTVLPRCERFETAWMFLEEDERQRASLLLKKVRELVGDKAADSLVRHWNGRLGQ